MTAPSPRSAIGAEAVMVYEFDSVQQARRWRRLVEEESGAATLPDRIAERFGSAPVPASRRGGEEAARRWYRGALRLASISAPTVVLTDSQVLDGVFPLAFGPDFVIDSLDGTAGALEIRGRAATFGESLRQFFLGARTDDAVFNRMHLSSLDALCDADRQHELHAMFDRLGGRDADEVFRAADARVPVALVEALESAYRLPGGALRGLARAWEAWAEAIARGRIRYRPYGIQGGARVPEEPASAAGAAELAPAAATLLDELRETPMRAEAFRLIRRARDASAGSAPGDERDGALADIGLVEAWYDFRYQQGLADRHDAGWLLLEENPSWSRLLAGALGPDTPTTGRVVLSGNAHGRLAAMTASAFGQFAYAHRDAIAEWRSAPSRGAARAIAYALREFSSQRTLRRERRALRRSSALIALLAAIAIGSALLDGVGAQGILLTTIAVVIVERAADVLPQLRRLWEIRDRSLSTTMFVQTEG